MVATERELASSRHELAAKDAHLAQAAATSAAMQRDAQAKDDLLRNMRDAIEQAEQSMAQIRICDLSHTCPYNQFKDFPSWSMASCAHDYPANSMDL